jgi:hypothetical protein
MGVTMVDNTRFISCTLGEGVFKDEYTVKLHIGEQQHSLYADKGSIEQRSTTQGLLRVRLIEEKGNFGVIALTSETIETGRQILGAGAQYPGGREF